MARLSWKTPRLVGVHLQLRFIFEVVDGIEDFTRSCSQSGWRIDANGVSILVVVVGAVGASSLLSRSQPASRFLSMALRGLFRFRKMFNGGFRREAWPRRELSIFDRPDPHWFCRKPRHRMIIADELRLRFELVHVCHCFRWWGPLGQEFGRWAVAQDCVGVGIGDVLDDGDAPQLGFGASPSLKYGCARHRHLHIICVKNIHLVLVKDCNLICVDEFQYAEQRVAFNGWYDVYVPGWHSQAVMECVHCSGRLNQSVGHTESFIGLLVSRDKCSTGAILCGTNVG